MGLASGKLNFTRYKIVCKSKTLDLDCLRQNYAQFATSELRWRGSAYEESCFWVPPLNAEDEAFSENWDPFSNPIDQGYLLRLRVERKKVPSELLRYELNKTIRTEENSSGKRLSVQRRRELRDSVKDNLLLEALPSINFFDVFLNFEQKYVLLFASGKGIRERFLTFFGKSIGKAAGIELFEWASPLNALPIAQAEPDEKTLQLVDSIAATVPTPFLSRIDFHP